MHRDIPGIKRVRLEKGASDVVEKGKGNPRTAKHKLKIELTFLNKLRTPVSGLPTFFMI